jgi:hypothetical protein
MRALILVAGAALALTACSSNTGAEDNNMAVDNLTVDNLVIDNTTAVDMNMDANMDANMMGDNAMMMNDMNAMDSNAMMMNNSTNSM